MPPCAGHATETDVDVGFFVARHGLSASAVTELLELLQRARGRDPGEPFALNHRALRSRISTVHGLTGDTAAGRADVSPPLLRGF